MGTLVVVHSERMLVAEGTLIILRRISLVVRILGFQSGEKGSIPLCAANSESEHATTFEVSWW